LKDWQKAALVYIGTVIGAGFASGQEILRFFVVYGKESFWGIAISGVLFGLIVSCVLCKTYEKKIQGADEYYADIAGNTVTALLNLVVSLFMFSSFCVMNAGSGALFNEQLNLPAWLGILVMCLLCAFIFLKDISGIVGLNSIFTPLMILGILFLGAYVFVTKKTLHTLSCHGIFQNWFISCMVYISYNTLTTVPVMSALGKLIHKKSDAIKAGVMCGITLFALSAVLWFVLSTRTKWSMQLPILHAMAGISKAANILYIPVLYIAMLTTAVSSGFGVIKTINARFNINGLFIIAVMCALAAIISLSGFSQLVEKLYSLFGVAGLGVLVIVLIDGIKYLSIGKPRKSKEKRKKRSNY